MVAFCACTNARLLPVSNEVVAWCREEWKGVKCQLVNFLLRTTISVAYVGQQYSPTEKVCTRNKPQAKPPQDRIFTPRFADFGILQVSLGGGEAESAG